MRIFSEGRVFYIGKYRGRVISNADPAKQFRVRVTVPDVYGEEVSPWAMPDLPSDDYRAPAKGVQVWVEFEQGDPEHPIYTGFIPSAIDGAQAAPLAAVGEDDNTTALLLGKGGGMIEIEEEDGTLRKILEPATLSQGTYPNIRTLRVGATFLEVDGTPEAPRIQAYHESGSYWEIGKTGQFMKVSKGAEHDWVKGSRTRVTTGAYTEVTGGTVTRETQLSERVTIKKNYRLKVGSDFTQITGGSLVQSIAGSRTITIGGLDLREAGSVKDISGGDRTVGSLGNESRAVTGAFSLLVGNKDFPQQAVGIDLTLSKGNISLTADTGAIAMAAKTTFKLTAKTTSELIASLSSAIKSPMIELAGESGDATTINIKGQTVSIGKGTWVIMNGMQLMTLLNTLITLYNAHTHPDSMGGTGTTTSLMTQTVQSSDLTTNVKVS